MTKATEEVYTEIVNLIDEKSKKLNRLDYEDLIDELYAHLSSKLDCIAEENKGK